jgi:hypothetical protein
MGIELFWDDDAKTTMLCEVRGSWTWDDMWKVLNDIKRVTDKANYEIGAILDVSEGLTFPGGNIFNQTALNHAKRMLQMGGDGTGPVVVVGASPMIKMVYDGFGMIDKKALNNVRFARTVDEARSMLNSMWQQRATAAAGA